MQPTFNIGHLVPLLGTKPDSADQHTYCIIDILLYGSKGCVCCRVKNMNGVEQVARSLDIKEAPADAIPQ